MFNCNVPWEKDCGWKKKIVVFKSWEEKKKILDDAGEFLLFHVERDGTCVTISKLW